jgi:hypothetical protein
MMKQTISALLIVSILQCGNDRATDTEPVTMAYCRLYGIRSDDPNRYKLLLPKLSKAFLPFRIVRGKPQQWPKRIADEKQLLRAIHDNALPSSWTEGQSREWAIRYANRLYRIKSGQ